MNNREVIRKLEEDMEMRDFSKTTKYAYEYKTEEIMK